MSSHSALEPADAFAASGSQKLPTDNTVMTDYLLQFGGYHDWGYRASLFYDVAVPSTSNSPAWYAGVLPQAKELAVDTVVIFFHPNAENAGYKDRNYNTIFNGTPPWANLYKKYAEELGIQVSAVTGKQGYLLVFPLIRSGVVGSFSQTWQDVVWEIAYMMGGLHDPKSPSQPATLRNVILAGFSRGSQYMKNFADTAVGLASVLRATIDLDGLPPFPASNRYLTWRYAQTPVPTNGPFYSRYGSGLSFGLPCPRWPDQKCSGVRSSAIIHGLFPIFMLYDGLRKTEARRTW